MTRRLGALVALGTLLSAAAAQALSFALPDPGQAVSVPPPLRPGGPPQIGIELRVPGRVASRELVTVELGPEGAPVAVAARQRLIVHATGDYSFLIAAPATTVVRAPGSASVPGLRDVGILWQGFSDRRRVLASDAVLRPGPAAAGLPLRVELIRRPGGTLVRLVELARRRMTVVLGTAARGPLIQLDRRALRRLRHTRPLAGLLYVNSSDGRYGKLGIAAPLRISGVLAAGAWRRALHTTMGAGGPVQRDYLVPGAAPPRLRLRIAVPQVPAILPTPSAVARAPQPLLALESGLAAAAIANAYHRYLASPDALGPATATYLYRTTPRPTSFTVAAPRSPSHAPEIALAILAAIAALAGGARLWARS